MVTSNSYKVLQKVQVMVGIVCVVFLEVIDYESSPEFQNTEAMTFPADACCQNCFEGGELECFHRLDGCIISG